MLRNQLTLVTLAVASAGMTGGPVLAAPVEEIVVQSDRDRRAATDEMASDNAVSVLTGEDLARNPDNNVAEALSRIPGINVMNLGSQTQNSVSIDSAGRGVGNYTSIRGMNGEYNVNQINGIDVAQGQPYSRAVELSLLPPYGLDHIVVNKSMTADLDGDAIGGIVDFRMPTAFDFDKPVHAAVSAGAGLESRALDYGRNGLGGKIAGEMAAKLGDRQQLGVYVGAYYDRRDFSNSEAGGIYPAQTNGMWTWRQSDAAGNNPAGMDPLSNLLLTGLNVGYTTGFTERYGTSASVDWHPDTDTTLFSRLTWARAYTQQNSYQSQIYGDNIGTGAKGGTALGNNGLFQPVIGGVQPRFWYETNPEIAELGTYQVGASKKLGRWTVDPSLFFSWGSNDRPNHMEISARNGETFDAIPYFGSQLFGYSGDFAHPLLTPAQIAGPVADIGNYGARRAGELSEEFSSQVKGGARVDLTYDAHAGWLDHVRFGAKYQDSFRQHTYRDWTTDKLYSSAADDPSLASLGFLSGSVSSIYPGQYNWRIPTIDQSALFGFFNRHLAAQPWAFDTCDGIAVNNWNCNTQKATEAVSAAYVMADLVFGSVTVIPGLRFEHTDINNTFWVIPQDQSGHDIAGHWGKNSVTYNLPLPSVQVNWRPDPDTVYRASISQSYTRPAFFQLGGGETVSHNADGTDSVTRGNPRLKAIEAINYDLSGSWANHHGGNASVGGFLKTLTHYIYDNNSQNSFVNAQTTVTGLQRISEPSNGGSGHVYGLEVSARQKFQDLPAPFDGFGLAGNVTWEHSAVHLNAPGLNPVERMQNQPNWMVNLQAFYEKNGFFADASYRYIGSYVTQYGVLSQLSAFDEWVRASDQVNLHAGFDTGVGLRVDASVENLLNGHSFFATIGRNSKTVADIVDSGRSFVLTARYSY